LSETLRNKLMKLKSHSTF